MVTDHLQIVRGKVIPTSLGAQALIILRPFTTDHSTVASGQWSPWGLTTDHVSGSGRRTKDVFTHSLIDYIDSMSTHWFFNFILYRI